MVHQSRGNISVSLLVFLLLIVLCSGACRDSEKRQAPEIRIGLIVYTQEGVERQSTLNAADMVFETIQAVGGLVVQGQLHKVSLIVDEVSTASPEEATAAAMRLINQEHVVAIVGPQFSSDAIPAGAVAEAAKIPLISPASTNPLTTKNRRYVFRMGFVDTLQGKAAAAFCRRELGLDRAGVIYNVIDPYSREIADVFRLTFEQHGGTVVVFETISSDSLEETLRRVEAQKPQLLYVPLYSRAAERVARGVRNVGIEVPLMGADGWERQRLKKLSDFEGCYATAHFAVDSDLPQAGPFVAEYRRRYDIDPGDTAALTYDAFNLLFAACRTAAGVTPEKIRQALYDLGPFDGVSGTIDFVDSGDPDKAVMILRFEGGEVFFHQRLQP